MRDLKSELTVFVIDAGNNPNLQACLQALKAQSCAFTLDVIKDYVPMSAAFQEMLARCKTSYYIQCDSDMVLNLNAVEKMYNDAAGGCHDTQTAMYCYQLRDDHLEMDIYGVKIYKHEIFAAYPYNLQHPSCEMEQLQRLEADGYRYRLMTETVGTHSPLWTPELIFERYFNLMEKYKIYRYVWMEDLPRMLWAKVKITPSDKNLYGLLGAMSSIFSDEVMDHEKDIRLKRKDYGRALGFIERPHQCTLYMTSRCNFSCEFCWRQHKGIEPAPEMTASMAGVVLAKFPKIQGFCLCGFGEPLLNPHLVDVLKILKAAHKYVGIITNGSLLARDLPQIRGWYQPDYISVSLNAHCRDEHERVTGTKTWDAVMGGMKSVLASKIELYVSSVVTRANIEYLPALLKTVKALGVKTVHLHNVLPHFDSTADRGFWDLALTKDDQHKVDALKALPEADIIKKYPVLIDRNGGLKACKFPWYSFAIDGAGNLSICNSVLPTNHETFGNIAEYVVWNSAKLQAFRDKFCKNEVDVCKRCFRNWSWI